MARLIDADALLKSEIRRCGRIPTIGTGYINEKNFESILAESPTVDAVEVVRCKNCAFYREAEDWDGNKYYACHKRAAVLIMQMKPDDFCSYGERRTDD